MQSENCSFVSTEVALKFSLCLFFFTINDVYIFFFLPHSSLRAGNEKYDHRCNFNLNVCLQFPLVAKYKRTTLKK